MNKSEQFRLILPRDEQEAAWAIEFRNTKTEAVTVDLTQPFTGQWRIVEESLPHRRDAAEIPGHGRGAVGRKSQCSQHDHF